LSIRYNGVTMGTMELPSTEQPGLRHPAPEGLDLVQAFINTNDREEATDELEGPEDLRAWLVTRGLIRPDVEVRDRDLARALALREALRGLAASNNGLPLDPDDLDALDRVADAGALRVRFTEEGQAHLVPLSPGVTGAMARLVADVYRSMLEGTWPRMKACRRHVCRWVFYDRSRNRSGTWCAMSVCGNRVKTRSYRGRRAVAPPG
jgi:predicted RNA-binding Zn ribbon-like protein